MIIVFIISRLPLPLLMPAGVTTRAARALVPCGLLSPVPAWAATPSWGLSITKGFVSAFVFVFFKFLVTLNATSFLRPGPEKSLHSRHCAWLRNTALDILMSKQDCSGERDGGGKAPDPGFICPVKGQQWEDTLGYGLLLTHSSLREECFILWANLGASPRHGQLSPFYTGHVSWYAFHMPKPCALVSQSNWPFFLHLFVPLSPLVSNLDGRERGYYVSASLNPNILD